VSEITQYGELNRLVGNWGKARAEAMKAYVYAKDIMFSGDLQDQIKSFLKFDYGKASVIKFQFPRYAIFVEKGVGKGYPIGSVSNMRKRIPKPWFSANLTDSDLDDLSNLVGSEYEEINVRLIKNSFVDPGVSITGEFMGDYGMSANDIEFKSDYERALFEKFYL
jgi:hypothetical protein